MPINAKQTKNPREQPNRSCKQTDKGHETSFPANSCIHAPVPLKPCNGKTRNRRTSPTNPAPIIQISKKLICLEGKTSQKTGRLEAGVTKGKGPPPKAAPSRLAL